MPRTAPPGLRSRQTPLAERRAVARDGWWGVVSGGPAAPTFTAHRILREFAALVREREPRARLWAFGSRARGDAQPDSDLDLCVVVPHLTPELRRRVRALGWQIGFEHERVLATVILPEEEFENGPISASALVRKIHAEGLAA